MNAFFFWAAWACTTNRPGSDITYTQNWPAEPLVANAPTGSIVVWSVISFVALLAGIGALAWYFAVQRRSEHADENHFPESDPLLGLKPTPSMRATLKYFWVVALLMVVQVGLGAVTAHYGVEGEGFYGIPLAEWIPYSLSRTWHTQLGIFWIATAWLATGLFMAPAVSGYEPKFQRLGVNVLFVCLLIIVGGSMAGQWFGVQQKLGYEANFWFGHQGVRVRRPRSLLAIVPVRRAVHLAGVDGPRDVARLSAEERGAPPARPVPDLLAGHLHVLRCRADVGAADEPGHRRILAVVGGAPVVEGFFEVFATVVIAFLFTRMGLLKTATATAAVLFSTIMFLSGGIVGTFHHLYFTGTPTAVLALGATFSAMEVVPLVLIGFEAYENLTLTRARPWVAEYKWPIYFFVSVAFWNLVGAGLFGSLINPPIALYYMQGLARRPSTATPPCSGCTACWASA